MLNVSIPVAPDAIYSHVKTYKEEARNMHYIAPEYGDKEPVTNAVDIYSFGICALEVCMKLILVLYF